MTCNRLRRVKHCGHPCYRDAAVLAGSVYRKQYRHELGSPFHLSGFEWLKFS